MPYLTATSWTLLLPLLTTLITPTTSQSTGANPSSTTTVSLLFGNTDDGYSVLSANADATTYLKMSTAICTEIRSCTTLDILTVTAIGGPSTAAETVSGSGVFQDVACKLTTSAKQGVCTFTVSSAGQPALTTVTTLVPSDFAFTVVTVTAGVEKLAAATTTAGPSGSSTSGLPSTGQTSGTGTDSSGRVSTGRGPAVTSGPSGSSSGSATAPTGGSASSGSTSASGRFLVS